jgi:hypothetical protein
MKPVHAVITCVLGSFALLAAVSATANLHYWKAIDSGTIKDEEIVAVTFDSDLFAATRAGYPDLRIVDEQQNEVPCQCEPAVEYRQTRTRQSVATQVVSLHQEGNAIQLRLRLPDSSGAAEGLSFETPLTNYERKISVLGSANGSDWSPLVPEGIIYDYTRFMDLANRDVPLPKNHFREFKVTIEDVTDEKESPIKELTRTFHGRTEDERKEQTLIERRPFRIDRIMAWHMAVGERVQQAKIAGYPIIGLENKDDTSRKATIITLRTHREPITHFTVETPSHNFSRRIDVEVPLVRGARTDWQPIAGATLFNFRFRTQQREQLSITFPERREETYRLVIHNEDNPPLTIAGVRAEGNVERLLFLAQPSRTYRVFYGSETVATPRYESATVLGALRQEYQPILATLGPQHENTGFANEPGEAVRGLLNNWFFLGAVICLMVAVLGWCLFRAGRRLQAEP